MNEQAPLPIRPPRQLALPFSRFEEDCNEIFKQHFQTDRVYEATRAELEWYWRMAHNFGGPVRGHQTSEESSSEA